MTVHPILPLNLKRASLPAQKPPRERASDLVSALGCSGDTTLSGDVLALARGPLTSPIYRLIKVV